MSAMDYLGAYAEGWTKGDCETILSATSDSFVFDDPNAGKVAKGEFTDFFVGLKADLASMRSGDYGGPFIELSEIVTKDEDGVLTASCWWEYPGTGIQGSGLIKVTDDGVVSERLAYYTKLPE